MGSELYFVPENLESVAKHFVGFLGNISWGLPVLIITGFLNTIYLIWEKSLSQIFNLQSQGHDGPNVKIQRVEYKNSILLSGFGAAGNSTR